MNDSSTENVRYVYREVQTTESTGKKWKALQLIGMAIMVPGIFLSVMGLAAEFPGMFAVGFAGFLLGTPVYFTGRIGGWWYHG